MKKIAVILFNLGGPSDIDHVEGFLFNLFNDKNIITLPNPFRWLLAKLISSTRSNKSKKLYQQMGGSSPILKNTQDQAEALAIKLKEIDPDNQYEIMISMRYSKPFSDDLRESIDKFKPDEIILLPLYPQYSTTTTKSSFEDFIPKFKDEFKIKSVCCYPLEENYIKSHQEKIRKSYLENNLKGKDVVILFSAHSIPQKCVDNGDPYQWQIEATVRAIMRDLNLEVSHKICYQSRVGRLKWLEPSTDSEIKNNKDKSMMIVPIAFVSDHLETLVELDIDYKLLANDYGVKDYCRVSALGIEDNFIKSLAKSTIDSVNDLPRMRICPKEFCKCGV
ncbi:Ferrochelatase [Candidatus Arcanobacter lacustris]|jgi:ferrochelatase|uniref:Ferrochelatase n=1 Tax=Candidatus Arcanibacter lacustris TaxID=1607817 RepID=A0A0F5MQ61_9RICK|nr:Ferrochelatase [Candidatus Arcanobacter lacustris]